MRYLKCLAWFIFGLMFFGSLIACTTSTPAAPPSVQGPAITAYVVNEDDNTVSVIDGAKNQVVATIAVGKWPHMVALSPDGQRAFVTNGDSATVSVIDTASQKVLAEIQVGKDPQGIAVVSKSLLYTANYDSNDVSAVDLDAAKVKATINAGSSMDPLSNPQDIVAAPDGKHVYVTNLHTGEVLAINTTTNAVENRIPLIDGTAGIGVDPYGKFLYVGGHGAMGGMSGMSGKSAMATPMAGAMNSTPTSGMNVASMAGEKNKEIRIVDLATNKMTGTITCGIMPIAIAFAKDGKRGYAVAHGSNELDVIDTTTQKVIGTVPVGKNPKALAISPDGSAVFVTNFDDGTVSLVDAAALKVTATITVGKSPHGIAVK